VTAKNCSLSAFNRARSTSKPERSSSITTMEGTNVTPPLSRTNQRSTALPQELPFFPGVETEARTSGRRT
jgi:hypothetical protein